MSWPTWLGLLLLWMVFGATPPPSFGSESGASPLGLTALQLNPARGDTLPAVFISNTWTDTLAGGAPPSAKDGDRLHLLSRWDRSDLVVAITNFDLVASGQDTLELANLGDGVYELDVEIPASNPGIADGAKSLSFLATTPSGAEATSTEDRLCLSNSPPQVFNTIMIPERTTFQAIDYLALSSFWTMATGLELEVFLDVSAIEPNREDPLLPATYNEKSLRWEVDYTIPANPKNRAEDGIDLPLVWIGRDSGCGVLRDTTQTIRLDHTPTQSPTLLSWETLSPVDGGVPRPLRDGDTLRLLTRWDRDSLAVSADFSELAPGDPTRGTVLRRGPAEYEIIYTLPDSSLRGDASGVRIVLAAEDRAGNVQVDRSVTVCLSNHSPVHLRTELRNEQEIYRGGDSLFIDTSWVTESGLDLEVGALFGVLEPDLGESVSLGIPQPDSSFTLVYRIPIIRDDRGPDGENILIQIVAREVGGCAEQTLDQIYIALDTTPPTDIPVLNPLPAETSADSIWVSGTATEGTPRVAITRERVIQVRTPVDPITGEFGAMISLSKNILNGISVQGEDEFGNRSIATDIAVVRQVEVRWLIFADPFTRDEELSVQDPAGMSSITLTIYDLEGSVVRRWTAPESQLEFTAPWNGRDEKGERARQGYYLVRATWTTESGERRKATEGLILAN